MANEFLSGIAHDSLPTEDDTAAVEIEFFQTMAESVRARAAQPFLRASTPAYASPEDAIQAGENNQWTGQPNSSSRATSLT